MKILNKLHPSCVITILLVLLSNGVFGDIPQDFSPHFQVMINNQLTNDLIATFYPTNYSIDLWNGVCTDRVMSTTSKTLCQKVPSLAQGIPADFTTFNSQLSPSDPYFPSSSICSGINFFDMPNGTVGLCHIDESVKIAHILKPFIGDIVIRNAIDRKEIAKIHYALQIHQATRWTWLERTQLPHTDAITPSDEGRYMQWDPIYIVSHDPNVNVTVTEHYPTGYNWCWLSEDSSAKQRDQGKTPCSSTPTITLSF